MDAGLLLTFGVPILGLPCSCKVSSSIFGVATQHGHTERCLQYVRKVVILQLFQPKHTLQQPRRWLRGVEDTVDKLDGRLDGGDALGRAILLDRIKVLGKVDLSMRDS